MINITEKEFSQFADYIKKHYGIHLKKRKDGISDGQTSKCIT